MLQLLISRIFSPPESIKEIHQLKFRIQDNKDQISSGLCVSVTVQNSVGWIRTRNMSVCVYSVSAALQQLPQLDSLRKKVEALECSFKHIIQNGMDRQRCDLLPLSTLSECLCVCLSLHIRTMLSFGLDSVWVGLLLLQQTASTLEPVQDLV